MTPDRIERARRAVADLSRADLRALSIRIGAARDELTDFADIGTPLPADSLAGFDLWFGIHETRSFFTRPRSGLFIASLSEATGLHPADVDAFRDGRSDLTPELRQRIHDHFTGQPRRAGPATVFGDASMPVMFGLRGEAMRIVRAMTDEQLATFVRDQSPAKAA